MKVKILYENYVNDLENNINDFIKKVNVKDIKICEYRNYIIALIIYEED